MDRHPLGEARGARWSTLLALAWLVLTGTAVAAPTGAASPPTITEFLASPTNVSVGGSTTLYVIVHGGALPLTYNYTGLPPGCATQNTSVLPCTPTSQGSFLVHVIVFAADGENASATASLNVGPPAPGPLALVGFIVYPSVVGPGNITLFAALATGGATPLSYQYTGLPPGCPSLPFPILPCRTTFPGVYTVALNVTDSRGNSVQSSVTLTVQAPASAGGATPTGSTGTSPWTIAEYLAIGVVVGAAVASVLFILFGRRRRRTDW